MRYAPAIAVGAGVRVRLQPDVGRGIRLEDEEPEVRRGRRAGGRATVPGAFETWPADLGRGVDTAPDEDQTAVAYPVLEGASRNARPPQFRVRRDRAGRVAHEEIVARRPAR